MRLKKQGAFVNSGTRPRRQYRRSFTAVAARAQALGSMQRTRLWLVAAIAVVHKSSVVKASCGGGGGEKKLYRNTVQSL